MRSPLRTVASNTGWLMLDRLTRMVLGVTVGAWLARHLGPESFGALAYVLALLALFQTATSLGLDLVLARDLAQRDAESHLLLGSCLRLRICAGVVGWVGACTLMAVLRPGDDEALTLTMLAGAVLLFQPSDLVDLWFQSQSQSRRAVLPRTGAFLLVSGLRVALILTDSPLWAFALAYVAEGLLAALFLWYSYRRHRTAQHWQWDARTARLLLRSGWPLLLSSLSMIVYMRVDQLLLRSLAGERELGLYSAVLPFSQAWHFIPTTLCASTAPFLVRLLADDPERMRRRMGDVMSLLTWISLAICAAMAMAAYAVIPVLLGPLYSGASAILAVHVLSIVPVFLGVAQLSYLTITGRSRIVLLQTLAGVVTSIALNLLLIPRYGALGSAMAIVGAQLVSAVLVNSILAPDVFRLQVTSWTRRPVF